MAKTETRERTQADHRSAEPAPNVNVPAQKSNHPVAVFREYAMQRISTLQELPHIDPQQLLSVALTAIQRKPDLMRCTPQSLWNACVLAAQDGLLPDGREGAIVPYGENADGKRVAEIATWMPMVEGLRKKVRNSGQIKDWYVELVYAGDFFRYRKGDDPRLEHEPVPPSQRTPNTPFHGIVAAYSIAVFTDGSKSAPEVMWIEEIEKVRTKSKAKNGPWQDSAFYPEMCKKVVARRHYKQLPHSAGMDKLIQRDDDDYDFDRQDEALVQQRQHRRLVSTTSAFDEFARNGQTIDHRASDPVHQDGDDEFAEDEPSHDETGADETDRTSANSKPETGGAADQREEAAVNSKDEQQQHAEPQQQTQAEQTTANDGKPAAKFDPHVGEEVRRWPPGAVPSDPDEYEFYVETKLSDYTRETADKIPDWWKSAEEKKLREACGISKQRHDELRNKAASRKTELLKG
ncbi:rect protein [Afipia carboxidovorans OM5]|uniref:RecT family protein n=1 Tax=Afipia carboxidovorans (strain ATCC 49405 / DSM 1227 / KCTC 32145 / OM5) TaxID=504832 RepID=B6JI05_AFIC5|nr:recombinase RecT [Afipia carboxidovorans]ACI92672.1 rect protein [Afipia carboxidovorans OM5]AEI03573.1 RecT family protein [Afipia carboxidovorans OM4]AEI07150.1 RecT family protein [Afipia carboxidovorans OM5]